MVSKPIRTPARRRTEYAFSFRRQASHPTSLALTARRTIPDSGGVARIYDLVMTHQLDADDLFIHRVQEHCARARLNFFLVEPLWVEAFMEAFRRDAVWPRVLLNMHSEHHQPDEVFHRLVRLATERKVHVIDPLDRAIAAFDKARLHPRLVAAGIHTPFTVVVPAAARDSFRLGDAERAALGSPFVIKPALGYGKRGVILDAASEADLERSAAQWPGGDFLFQRRIVPRQLQGEPAYFRAFFVFGSVWVCWWHHETHRYRLVTWDERTRLGLDPVEELLRRVAALTGMNFFSSEIAQTESGEFVIIDYVNDQCHMLSQSASPGNGVPDELVENIARRLIEAVVEMLRPSRSP